MDRVENVATPLTAATVAVPDSAPPFGLKPMDTVMLAVEPVTVLLNASCTVTCTAGLIATPAVAFVGCAVKASLDAAAGLMVKATLPAPVSAPEAAVSVERVPGSSLDRL